MRATRFRRTSHHSPAEHEILEITVDGTFSMWRSTGEVIGRFGGRVPEFQSLSDAVEHAAASPIPETEELPMDASLEQLDVDGRTLSMSADDEIEGSWGRLVAMTRLLIDNLRDQPRAALAIRATDPGQPELVQRGDETLVLELIQPMASVSVWRDSQLADSTSGFADVIERVDAVPGWTLAIPAGAITTQAGDIAVIEVGLDAYDGEVPLPVHVHAYIHVT